MNFTRSPLWVYGHSFTADTSPTSDWEWMPKLADKLGMPDWTTYGVSSSRLVDVFGDLARAAPTQPMPGALWPWNPPRRGAVVLQCETNDAICPASNAEETLPLNGRAIANYQQTLEACLGLLAAEYRWDWSVPSASYGAWGTSSSPMFYSTTNAWTDQAGAWREMKVNVGSSGIIGLITWDVSPEVTGAPVVGAYQIAVDGIVLSSQSARTTAWQTIWSRRGGGYRHTIGPRLVTVGGINPGVHTIRLTKVGDPGRVYVDQLITLAAEPVPVLVTKDPKLSPEGTSWVVNDPEAVTNFNLNRRNLHGAINRAVARFPNARAVSLAGFRAAEHYQSDGIHPSPAGMDYLAAILARALDDFVRVYEPDLLYT